MVTATPNPSEVRSAGFFRRGIAALLDAVPALTLWWAASLGMSAEGAENVPSQWNLLDRVVDTLNTSPGLVLWPIAWGVLGSVAWHTLTVSAFGTSPGKRVVGLKVVSSRGEAPGPARAFAHALMRSVSSACLALGPLWALADPERRTLYDRLSGIYVSVAYSAPSSGNRRR